MARPVHAVHEQNVLPAIGVVIEKGATRAHGFRQHLAAKGAAIVMKPDAGARGRIGKTKSKI